MCSGGSRVDEIVSEEVIGGCGFEFEFSMVVFNFLESAITTIGRVYFVEGGYDYKPSLLCWVLYLKILLQQSILKD